VRKVFAEYHENWHRSDDPVVLLINEADGLMNKRVQINTSIDAFSNHAQTELLEQLENFKGILIATTNLLDNIDNAFHRRFLFKTEIQPPCSRLRANYLQYSSLTSLLSSAQMRLLESGSWTIAELKNLERKIQFLSRVKSLSDHELNALLIDSGLYGNNRKLIGFQLIGR
jgi:ATP-dependent 26S proteasome regulatory subunit